MVDTYLGKPVYLVGGHSSEELDSASCSYWALQGVTFSPQPGLVLRPNASIQSFVSLPADDLAQLVFDASGQSGGLNQTHLAVFTKEGLPIALQVEEMNMASFRISNRNP